MPSNRRDKEMPDLFDGVAKPRGRSSSMSSNPGRLVLPGDLAGALKSLDDDQLDALLKTVTTEAKRTEVFQRRNGRWVLIGAQGTPVTPADAAPYRR